MPITAFRNATIFTQAAAPPFDFGSPPGAVWVGSTVHLTDAGLSPNTSFSQYLIAAGFGFTGLGLPPTDVVMGFSARIRKVVANRTTPLADVVDWQVRIMLGGVILDGFVNPDFSSGIDWPNLATLQFHGVLNDNMNLGVVSPQIQDLTEPGFGIALSARYDKDIMDQSIDGEIDATADLFQLRIRHEPFQARRDTIVSLT